MTEEAAGRRELKYLISDSGVRLLESRLAAVMQRDPHAGPTGRYFVRSLYFDDPTFTAYRDKLSGVENRAKYRLRLYDLDDGYIVFEKKEKRGDVCFKQQVGMTREGAMVLIRGDTRRLRGDLPPIITEYRALTLASRLRPAVIVDYDRIPFRLSQSNARATLDLNVRAGLFTDDLFGRDLLTVPVLEQGEQILELKYDAFAPPQMAAAVSGVPAMRMAVSKYCKCLSVLE